MTSTKYPNLREALAESHRRLPDSVIERVLARQGLEAGAVEDFWDVVSSALPAVGSLVGSVLLPGVGTAAVCGEARPRAGRYTQQPARDSTRPASAPTADSRTRRRDPSSRVVGLSTGPAGVWRCTQSPWAFLWGRTRTRPSGRVACLAHIRSPQQPQPRHSRPSRCCFRCSCDRRRSGRAVDATWRNRNSDGPGRKHAGTGQRVPPTC